MPYPLSHLPDISTAFENLGICTRLGTHAAGDRSIGNIMSSNGKLKTSLRIHLMTTPNYFRIPDQNCHIWEYLSDILASARHLGWLAWLAEFPFTSPLMTRISLEAPALGNSLSYRSFPTEKSNIATTVPFNLILRKRTTLQTSPAKCPSTDNSP